MKRSERLDVVLRLYQRKEDEQARQVEVAREQLGEHQGQLDQLVSYRASYQATVSTQDSVSIAQWRRLQDYIDQLTGIIGQQERQVELSRVEVERAEARWRQAHLDRKSMETAIERIAGEEQMQEARLEQKNLDEMIQQMQARRRR